MPGKNRRKKSQFGCWAGAQSQSICLVCMKHWVQSAFRKKISRGAVKIAPWAKAMAAKSAGLSEIPGNPMVEGEQ